MLPTLETEIVTNCFNNQPKQLSFPQSPPPAEVNVPLLSSLRLSLLLEQPLQRKDAFYEMSLKTKCKELASHTIHIFDPWVTTLSTNGLYTSVA